MNQGAVGPMRGIGASVIARVLFARTYGVQAPAALPDNLPLAPPA